MIKKIAYLMTIFLAITLFTTSAFAAIDVEIFNTYDTKINITADNKMIVHKQIKLRNVHDVGIVPGDIEFKIRNDAGTVELLNYTVKDRYGQPISSKKFQTPEFYMIQLNVFTPVLPGFDYTIDLEYELQYEPKGIFFKSIQVPLKDETKIPIKEGKVILNIPDNYYLTHVSYKTNTTDYQAHNATWQLDSQTPSELYFEYSYIPLRIGNLKGSVLFWIIVNLILVFILYKEIRRKVKKYKKHK